MIIRSSDLHEGDFNVDETSFIYKSSHICTYVFFIEMSPL